MARVPALAAALEWTAAWPWVALALVASLAFALLARAGERLGRVPACRAFANASPPSFEGGARLAFLGDVQRGIRDVARPLVEALARERVALLVSSGDLHSHGEAPYYGVVARAFEEAGLSTPTLVVPGNHDVEPGGVRDAGPGRLLFERAVGPRRWTTRVGALWVAGIDDASGAVDPHDVAWLEAGLAAHAGRWLLVCHKPPRRVDRDGAPAIEGGDALVALLERRPPEAVVAGHLHDDADLTLRGVRYFVNVQGGDFEKKRWFAPPEFRLVLADVASDGAVALRRVPLRRRGSARTAWRQLAVRAWVESRRGVGRVLGAPGAALLRVLAPRGQRAAEPAEAGTSAGRAR
jgi:hypothetical protein